MVGHGPQVGVEAPPDGETGAPPHLHIPGGRGLTGEGRRSARAGAAAGLTSRVWGGIILTSTTSKNYYNSPRGKGLLKLLDLANVGGFLDEAGGSLLPVRG